jgi:hypothetical protein
LSGSTSHAPPLSTRGERGAWCRSRGRQTDAAPLTAKLHAIPEHLFPHPCAPSPQEARAAKATAPSVRFIGSLYGGWGREEARRGQSVEKPAAEEPSGHRFLAWVVRHIGKPSSRSLQGVKLTGGYCWSFYFHATPIRLEAVRKLMSNKSIS